MGVAVFAIYQGIYLLSSNNLISTLFSVALGAIIYFLLLVLLQCFNKEELVDMPMGGRIYKLIKPLLK